MKHKISELNDGFKPIALEITFESKRELEYFMTLVSGSVKNELEYVNERLENFQTIKPFEEIPYSKPFGDFFDSLLTVYKKSI